MKSASVKGPIGTLVPSFMALSMSSLVETPSIRQKIASLIHGMRTLLVMNPNSNQYQVNPNTVRPEGMRLRAPNLPGTSLEVEVSLENCLERSLVACSVSLDVCRALMISTRFITGTGLKKCMPMTLSGLWVVAAILVMLIDEVFEAKIAWLGVTLSKLWKIFFFSSKFSLTASITKSDSAAPSN